MIQHVGLPLATPRAYPCRHCGSCSYRLLLDFLDSREALRDSSDERLTTSGARNEVRQSRPRP